MDPLALYVCIGGPLVESAGLAVESKASRTQ